MSTRQHWALNLYKGDVVPFSMHIGDHTAQFNAIETWESVEDCWHKITVVYREIEEPLTIFLTCRYCQQFTVVQQTLRLVAKNSLSQPIGNIRILDIAVPNMEGEETVTLHGITGGLWDGEHPIGEACLVYPPRGLKPWQKVISVGEEFHLDSDLTGRGSNKEIPLWLYAEKSRGLWLGPEWSGCWDLTIKKEQAYSQAKIGLPTFNFTLAQGEQINLPTAAFGLYSGDHEDGFNALRKAIREYYLPPIEGEKPKPPVLFQGLAGFPSYQDEPTLYKEVDQAARVGCESFVLDAGWNTSPKTVNWWEAVGNWDPHPERYPGGITRFARYVHGKGMKLGIWLEPRAHEDSKTLKNNKSIFLAPRISAELPSESIVRRVEKKQYLLDLGKKEAQDFFIELLERFIVDYKADWIWFDFNTEPRTVYWNAYEEANRRGLMELGFYQGLYRVFEAIHQRYPYVWLETCASGGRLIDLAQLKRFHSIWINDQSLDYDQNRNYRSGMNRFFPAVYLQSGFFINSEIWEKKPDRIELQPQHLLVSFGGAFQFTQGFCFWEDRDIKQASRYVDVYKRYRHYLEKDYYELFPLPESKNAWDGWQYHDPKTKSGILILFRLKESTEEEKRIVPRRLRNLQEYSYSVVMGKGEIGEVEGSLKVRLDNDGAVLIHYQPR